MKYKFNCQIATEKIEKLKKLKEKLDEERGSNIDQAFKVKLKLEEKLAEAEKLFDPDQMALRSEVAEAKGYDYVGKFNRFGLARSAREPEPLEWHGSEGSGYGGDVSFLIDQDGNIVVPEGEPDRCNVMPFSEGLATVEERKKIDSNRSEPTCYFVNENGKRITDKTYETAEDFLFGVAIVQLEGDYQKKQFRVIDVDGNEIRKITLGEDDDMRWSKKGYLGLHRTQYGAWYITPEGKRIPSDPRQFYDQLGDLNNPCGVAGVLYREGVHNYKHSEDPHFFYVNREGERLKEGILSQDFEAITEFYKDRAFVRTKDGNQYLIDIHGNPIKEFPEERFGEMRSMGNRGSFEGICCFSRSDGSISGEIYTNVSIEGDIVLPPAGFDEVSSVGEGIRKGKRDGKCFLIHPDGKTYELEYVFDYSGNRMTSPFKEGVAKMCQNIGEKKDSGGITRSVKDCFYIDKKGKRVFSEEKGEGNEQN